MFAFHSLKVFEESLKRHPGDIPLSIGLAGLLRKNREMLVSSRPSAAAEADKVMRRDRTAYMIRCLGLAENSQDPPAAAPR